MNPPRKLIRNGEVAVILSRNYGAGWSTTNRFNVEGMLFDSEIAQAILDGNFVLADTLALAKFPENYLIPATELSVQWVPQGERFELTEYDGVESIVFPDRRTYFVA